VRAPIFREAPQPLPKHKASPPAAYHLREKRAYIFIQFSFSATCVCIKFKSGAANLHSRGKAEVNATKKSAERKRAAVSKLGLDDKITQRATFLLLRFLFGHHSNRCLREKPIFAQSHPSAKISIDSQVEIYFYSLSAQQLIIKIHPDNLQRSNRRVTPFRIILLWG